MPEPRRSMPVTCTTMDCEAVAVEWVRLYDYDAPKEDIPYCRDCTRTLVSAQIGFVAHGPYELVNAASTRASEVSEVYRMEAARLREELHQVAHATDGNYTDSAGMALGRAHQIARKALDA